MSKRRVYISDHGNFNLFNMDISLPAILELTDEQIEYINNTGLYQISELSAAQLSQPLPTALSAIEGSRFDATRTISVNELSFKTPIMGTQYAKKAKNAIIVKKNSIYAKAASNQNHNNNTTSSSTLAPAIQQEIKTPAIAETPKEVKHEEDNNKKKKNSSEESK